MSRGHTLKVFDLLYESKGVEFIETQKKVFTVYVLRGPKNHLYIGSTSDIDKRLIRHKNGNGAEFTLRNKTFELVYKEEYSTLIEARRRESQIKKWRREKKENLIKFGKPVVK